MSSMERTLSLHPLSSFNFGPKDAQPEPDKSVPERMARLEREYNAYGARRSVDAILMVHDHHHPHALLLQIGGTFYKMPGGELSPGEDELEGLYRILTTLLAPVDGRPINWQARELSGVWYRPSFDNNMFPYCPAHVTKPKEVRKIYFVDMPEKTTLSVPKNYKLAAVPLFELYENTQAYGNLIASIPAMLSKCTYTYL